MPTVESKQSDAFPVWESTRFELSDQFVGDYADEDVPWGFGDLSYLTFKRTYARDLSDGTSEDWYQACRRVIEGMFTVQKTHCHKKGLPWDEAKARRFARDAYDRMFNFKWTPPGRGIRNMGCEYIYTRGGACLNNCGFSSTKGIKDDYSKSFMWQMDMSMLGVGVGFDTRGAGEVTISEPEMDPETHVIPDTRLGWVRAVGRLLDAFVGDDTLPIEWDYSEIRPEGAKLETFGGKASGPAPLKRLLDELEQLYRTYIGSEVDSRLIVDTMNMIGRCVISGGIRRTAQISFGEKSDDQFLDLKQDKEKLAEYRWASNNSVFADIGMDYSDVAERTADNGEPGYMWLENARAYGRMKDEPDYADSKALGANPCVTGDTLVAVADGRDAVSIQELAESGRDVPVYAVDPDSGKVEVKTGRHPRKTKTDSTIFRVHLDGDQHIDVTPNHTFLLRDGTEIEAKDLESGHSLMRFTKHSEKLDNDSDSLYYRIYCDVRDPSSDKIFEHRLIARHYDAEKWDRLFECGKQNGWIDGGGVVVHHRNRNTTDNRPDNLEIMTFEEHAAHHGELDNSGEDNSRYTGFSNEDIEEHAIALTKKLDRRFSVDEWREYCERNGTPKGPYNNFRSDEGWFESMHGLATWAASECGVDYKDKDPRQVRVYQDMLSQGYDARIHDKVEVKRSCERCDRVYWVSHDRREQSFCSKSCGNHWLNSDDSLRKKRNRSIRAHYDEVKSERRSEQARVYSELKCEIGKKPLKQQWKNACEEEGIPSRTGEKSPFRYWSDVVEAGEAYNHKVVEVEQLDEKQDVYNITVDDHHTVSYITESYENSRGGLNWSGVFTRQCGEQTLEDKELCCLVETFPAHHESLDDFKQTLKVAYQYAKTVTLIPTHDEQTNSVMLKNRRIGCSTSGIVQAINKHGYREYMDWCDEGYDHIQKLDKKYSDWLCIPRSIKTTSVKPSGTVSLLAGATPGIHWDHGEYYIRRIRANRNQKILEYCRKAGYHVEPDVTNDRTMVIEVPVKVDNVDRHKHEVSAHEKMQLAADVQHYWSDNQVSCTVEFDPETEADSIPRLLAYFEDKLKAISFLPSEDHGYEQAPYERITEEEYEQLREDVGSLIDVAQDDIDHDREDKFCSGESCEV